MKAKKLLLVEDATSSRTLAASYLSRAGFKVEEVSCLAQARLRAGGAKFDLAIIDLDLDPAGAIELVSELAPRGMQVIVISQAAEAEDRVICFEHGAQDFVTRPIDLRELHLRVARLWRSESRGAGPVSMEMACGDAVLDIAKRLLKGPSRTRIPLTASEFRLLFLLLKGEGTVIERHAISRDVLGHDRDASSRSVDVMVSKLRRKLELAGAQRFIRSIRSEGYLLIGDERQQSRPMRSASEPSQSTFQNLPDET